MAELSLSDQIDAEIRASGPMSVATYMALCLGHPRDGYYVKGRPIGTHGDFITAPEISQMFGELVGFFFVNLWQQMGSPTSFTLLELGPGRGTLMQDALRAATRADGFQNALHLQLFESNVTLRAEQAKRLDAYAPYWAAEIDAVSDDPLFVVANEFFDALPILQLERADDGWHERLIGLRDEKRVWGLSPVTIDATSISPALSTAPAGSVFETSPASAAIMQKLSRKVATQGGAILAIDYGYAEPPLTPTLQAVRKHSFADALDAPGGADLSAHVDFGLLARTASAIGLTTTLNDQGDFLLRLGIGERARTLARSNPNEANNIATAIERLTSPAQMGRLFKALCAHSPGLKPAGFA